MTPPQKHFYSHVFFIHLHAGFFHTFVCTFFPYICMRVFVIHLYAILYACFCHTFVCVSFSYIFTLAFGLAVVQWWVWLPNNQRVGGSIPTHCSTKGLMGRQLKAWQFTSLSQLRYPWARHPMLPGCCNWLSSIWVYFFHTFLCLFFTYICMRFCMRVFVIHLNACFFHTFVCVFACNSKSHTWQRMKKTCMQM